MRTWSNTILLMLLFILAVPFLLHGICALPNFTTYGPESGLTGKTISAMAANERTIWVNSWYPTTSGATGGLSTFSFRYENWTTYGKSDGLAADVLQGLGIDSDGKVWICHALGVQVFDPSKAEFLHNYGKEEGLLGAAQDVAFQGNDIVWVGTTEGLARFDIPAGRWKMLTTKDGLVHDKVFTIAVDGDVLWIGTGGGVSRFDTANNDWQSYTTAQGLPDNIINKIVVAGKNVWLATRKGLVRMKKKNGAMKIFGKAQGLPSDNVEDVALFRDRIWVATHDGVGKFEGRWKVVSEKDGLPVTTVSGIATQKDYIWFATPAGIARYGPVGPGLSFNSPYFLILALGVAAGIILMVAKPGAKKPQRPGERRTPKPAAAPRKAPDVICGGVPQRELCTRCRYYTLKGDAFNCAKYKIPIVFTSEGDGHRLRQTKHPSFSEEDGQSEKD